MGKFVKIGLLITVVVLGLGIGVVSVEAEVDCSGKQGEPLYECLGRQIGELEEQLESSKAATAPLQAELDKLEGRIGSIQAQIRAAEQRRENLQEEIKEREDKLAVQYVLLRQKLREYYKRMRSSSSMVFLLSEVGSGEVSRDLGYREVATKQDRKLILSISDEIVELEKDKEEVEESKVRLASLQAQLDKQKEFFEREIAGARAFQRDLEGQISELTSKQQAILAARSGSFTTSAGMVPIGSDYNASIAGFRSDAPGNSFSVFAFGAYTHRKGMSQYGARGRAENGQGYQDILQAYYGKRAVNKDTGGTISVEGKGNLEFDGYYLYGIAEMPSDWHVEALKAQAIAARTYAYRYKVEGRTICTSQSCQVFNEGKANNPPSNWKNAVDQTRGEVLEDVTTFYSSTTGGYLNTMGWDTTDGSGDGEWTSRAWESKAGSPWFYKAWYKYFDKYGTFHVCDARTNPWLSEKEMADVLNAWLILKKGEGSGVDTGRIVPVTINQCPIGGESGDPYGVDELKSKLSNPVTSISGVSSTHDGTANTTNVTFQTNRGSLSISGYEFKEVFNTRAPGYISIPQKGYTFFNVESK